MLFVLILCLTLCSNVIGYGSVLRNCLIECVESFNNPGIIFQDIVGWMGIGTPVGDKIEECNAECYNIQSYRSQKTKYRSRADDWRMITYFIAMAEESLEGVNRKWKYHSSNNEAMCKFAVKNYLINILIKLFAKRERGDNHVIDVEYAGTHTVYWPLGAR